MLADLLDKKETPLVNGVIGEKGLELVEKAILVDKQPPVVVTNNNNGVVTVESEKERTSSGVSVISGGPGEKRSADGLPATGEPEAKRAKTGTGELFRTRR